MSERIIADRYHLLRELGRGGMATVFLAVDAKHGREVALKVFRPELAALVGRERFRREIDITAALNHPHILPLLDSGDDAGLLFYVMPYLAGGSLRRLLSAGEVPLPAVVRIAREVASALAHAHARDVIHRDVKPENILFSEGLAVVSDFGIARGPDAAGRERVTATGLSLGTPGYMSPEQALGAPPPDARTDIYSLGAVVYELLVGQTPVSWPGAEDVELGRFADLDLAHRRRLDALPGRVEQVLVRALALRPQHRFNSPGALATALADAAATRVAFTDAQIRLLLLRAAELEAAEPDASGAKSEPGDAPWNLTIGAVEQIAAQVGIPPVHVRAAARELAGPDPGQAEQSGEAGPAAEVGPAADVDPADEGGRSDSAADASPTGKGDRADVTEKPANRAAPSPPLYRSRGVIDWRRLRAGRWNRLAVVETVDGKVSETAFPAMVAEIERHLGMVGHASVIAGALTWSPATQTESTRKVMVQVTPQEGKTEIRVAEDLEIEGERHLTLPIGGLGGGVVGMALGHALSMGDAAGAMAVVLGAAGVFAAVRVVVGFQATARAPGLEELAGSLAELGREAT